jgi:rsbT co-antagonist protein RsbR
MARETKSRLSNLLRKHETAIQDEWTKLSAATIRRDLMSEAEMAEDSRSFFAGFVDALQLGDMSGEGSSWTSVRETLASIGRSRAARGFSPTETAMFIFSLKQPLMARIRDEGKDPAEIMEDVWAMTTIIDKLGLHTTEMYQKGREEVIMRQQQELLELSTPVVNLWNGILALPLIGTLDSARTQVVMESLLERIVETGAAIAIIDITGVPTVDTLVAQHLLKTVAAARLMGADCIISGIRPQIAQTIIHLGVNLSDVSTKATLADAFALALVRTKQRVVSVAGNAPAPVTPSAS